MSDDAALDINAKFARKMKDWRIEKRYSQAQLSEDLELRGLRLTQQKISMIEDGIRKVPIGEAIIISTLLGFDLMDLEEAE